MTAPFVFETWIFMNKARKESLHMTEEQMKAFQEECDNLTKEHAELLALPDDEFLTEETTKRLAEVDRKIVDLCKRLLRA